MAGQKKPASLLLKAPSACCTDEGKRIYPGSLGGGWAASQTEMVGPGAGWGGGKGSESQNGDVFWNQPTGFADGLDVGDEQRRELSRAPPGLWPEHLGGWGSLCPRLGNDWGGAETREENNQDFAPEA